MEVTQIYDIVNNINQQSMGGSDIAVVDTTSLVSLGNEVLSSSVNTENFLNTLVQRIGRTIISYRQYKSMFNDLVVDDFQWGNILQKIKIQMPAVESDESYNLTDGTSVDMYKVNKPKVVQKLFTTESPYQIKITIQRVHLEEAFTNAKAMGAFINAIFGEVQNAIELSLENLGRACLNNYIAECVGTLRAVNLLHFYNIKTNKHLTAATAPFDADFLRWSIGYIKLVSRKMMSMSKLYNDGTAERHTPKEVQKLYVLSDWETQFETVVQYSAFNQDYVKLDGFKELPYLQSVITPGKIDIKRKSDGAEKTLDNIVCCLFDRDALGIMKKQKWTSTSPFNSAGGYYNTFYHMKEMYFNDLSENFVVFYIADD